MSVDPKDIRNCQARLREAAQKFSIEAALNGLAAVAAEAIVSAAETPDARDKLVQVFTAMLLDYLRSTAAANPGPVIRRGMN